MTSEELIYWARNALKSAPSATPAIAARHVEARVELDRCVRERDLMREAIRRGIEAHNKPIEGHSSRYAWFAVMDALKLHTDSPLVDLSATTEQETE